LNLLGEPAGKIGNSTGQFTELSEVGIKFELRLRWAFHASCLQLHMCVAARKLLADRGTGNDKTRDSRRWLAELYTAWGRNGEAPK